MEKKIELVYKSYLSRDIAYGFQSPENRTLRAIFIEKLVKEHDGRQFFFKYSTRKDSILEFIRKVDDKNLW